MTNHSDIDAINAHLERQHNQEMRMVDEGRCVGCGGKFLAGLDDAWVADLSFYLCFWCWDKENYDPYDPKPSKFNYGRC